MTAMPPSAVQVATLANVAASATSVTLFAANTGTRGRTVYNDSSSIMYLKFGTTASSTSFTVIVGAGGYYEFPVMGGGIYGGVVDAIWASATGSARTTVV